MKDWLGEDAPSIIGFITMTMLSMGFVILLVCTGFGWLLYRIFRSQVRGGRGAAATQRIIDPLEGLFTVTGVSIPVHSANYQNCEAVGVLQAEGIASTPARFVGIVESRKFPKPEQILPVILDRKSPETFVIQWEKVTTGTDQAMQKAQALANLMAGQSRDKLV